MNQTESRKDDHIKIALDENVKSKYNYWDYIKLVHNALPELNKNEINYKTTLLGKKISAPIIIAGMTGGHKKAEKINKNLAIAAEKYQIGMGVGSQRAALEKKELVSTYSVVKEYDVPLIFSNIGISQIVEWGAKKTLEHAEEIIDMINADVFTICLNYLQEVVQSEGDSDGKGAIEIISYLSENLDTPVMVKESGAGISYDVAKKLTDTKVSAIDVGGLSGTSFSAIECYRSKKQKDDLHARGGETFWNWGIPTPTSIIETIDATENKIPIISTGGIRNGLDAAKSIVLGAEASGIARSILGPATKGKKETMFEVEAIIKELRATMFLTGSKNLSDLKDVDWTVVGDKLWM